MFWKRKGKKKDAGAAGDTATVTLDEARDEKAPSSGTAGATAAGAEDTAAEKAGTEPADKDRDSQKDADEQAEPADAKADTDTDADAKVDDVSSTEDDSDGEAAAVEKSGTADEDGPAAGAADEEGTATGASAVDEAPEKDGADSSAGTDADDAEEAGADSEKSEDEESEDEDGGSEQAARKHREIEPEEPGIGETDEDGVQRVRTAGVLEVDDEEYNVVSNTWIVKADDEGVIVIDPAHDAELILEAVGDREIYLVACTNGYNTHIGAAVEVAERDEAPIALHRRELRPWRRVHGAEHRPEIELEGGGSLKAGDLEIDVLPLPGTSSGSVGYSISELGVVFSGDTLRAGELGTVGEGYVDYTRQLHSVGEVLLSLPPDTRVLPDSGPETSVEEESGNFDSWV